MEASSEDEPGVEVPHSVDDTATLFDWRDEQVLNVLAIGWNHAEAAAVVGREAKFVQRRLQDDRFAAELRVRRAAQLDAIVGQLSAIGPRAVSVVLQAMDDDDVGVRLRAGIAVLTTIARLGRQAELERRMAALEVRSLQSGRRRPNRRRS